MKLKLKMSIKILATIKKCLTLVIIQLSQNVMIINLVVGKMKYETASVAITEFVGLKPNIYSYLVDDNSKHKKEKSINKNVVPTISHNEYKCVLLNKKYLRHSMNRTQSKDHRIGIYEINKISLSCFDDKIYIQNNGCDGLALGYWS